MGTRIVFIINGFPRSGKDTFANAFLNALRRQATCASFSSIDPVFDLFRSAGIPMDRANLTDNDRCALAEVGVTLENRYGFRVAKCMNKINEFFDTVDDGETRVLFIHMREPEYIEKLLDVIEHKNGKAETERDKIHAHTVLVRRPHERTDVDNPSDQKVLEYDYDMTIRNNGAEIDLTALAERLAAEPHKFAAPVSGVWDAYQPT